MARRSERALLTIPRMRLAIPRLNKRIAELQHFDASGIQKRFNPTVEALEIAIDETLTSVFGHDTVEYNRYRFAARLDKGPVVLMGDPPRGLCRNPSG